MKEKRALDKKAFLLSALCGSAVSLAAYFAVLALAARLILSGALGEDRISAAIIAAAFLAAFSGGAFAVVRYRRRAVTPALASALIFFAALYLIGFAAYDDLSLGRYGAEILPAALSGGAAAGLAAKPRRSGKKRKIGQKRLKKT
jgi:putative membrane protein (TIGR04086 family)